MDVIDLGAHKGELHIDTMDKYDHVIDHVTNHMTYEVNCDVMWTLQFKWMSSYLFPYLQEQPHFIIKMKWWWLKHRDSFGKEKLKK